MQGFTRQVWPDADKKCFNCEQTNTATSSCIIFVTFFSFDMKFNVYYYTDL